MEQQHTQEPWRANDAQADIDGQNGEPVAVCYCNDDKGDDAIANARRIVACVNACAGISTEQIEAYPSAVMRIMKERDELLAALEEVRGLSAATAEPIINAAIASVKCGEA